MEIAGSRVLITGGSMGIGLALAEKCARAGARVVINARNEERLNAAAERAGVGTAPGDVGDEEQARRIVADAVAELGGLDVLVNNAGWGTFTGIDRLEVKTFDAMWRTNVLGAALMTREALPHLVAGGGGNIVNVSSTAGKRGFAGGSAYVATKFALSGMSQCWQAELRPKNVRVILIHPSEVQTGFGGREGGGIDPRKLIAEDIAQIIVSALELDDRGFIPELTVFATNPWPEN